MQFMVASERKQEVSGGRWERVRVVGESEGEG